MPRSSYALATYVLQAKLEGLEQRAEGIAVGLTVGSWTDLPAAKQSAMEPFRGIVDRCEVLREFEDGTVEAKISIGYPTRNLTAGIPALLTTVFGKLSMDGVIRLADLQLPPEYVAQFSGPKFGVAGIREKLGVHHRPLVMSIFKSCIGQSLDDLADHFLEQANGGVDLIKDDEIFFSEQLATPEQRVQLFREIVHHREQATGKRLLYAVNLTGPTFDLRDRARRLCELGAGALLINVLAYGYDVLQQLAADAEVTVPIMAHPAIAGALYGSKTHGIASDIILGQLVRLAGADIAIYPSPYGSVTLPTEEGQALVDALRIDNGLKPSLPAPSAGVHPGLVPTLVRDFGFDIIVNAGGAIHGHPSGSTAGGQAFVDAVEAVVAGQSLEDKALTSKTLQQAVEKWGLPVK